MTLPNGPVPKDVYDVCVKLVAKCLPLSDDEKRKLRSWCGIGKVGDYEAYRKLAAKVVIHAAALKNGVVRECVG